MARNGVYVVVKVKVDAEDAKDLLRNMKDRTQDFGPVLQWAGKELERAFTKNYTSMGALSATSMLGGAWPPLNPRYAAWKARRYPGAPTLVQTGELFRSVANISESIGNVMTDMSATFEVDSPIAKFHQFGTENMPARKIVFVPREFDRDIGKKAAMYIVEGAKIT